MVLRQLVSDLMNEMRTRDLMSHVEQLTTYDRYQASKGIQQAAAYVADVGRRVGLEDVAVEQFPADGKTRWWTYDAPVSWTPKQARLLLTVKDRLLLDVDHASHPMALATYSAATAPVDLVAKLVNVNVETAFPDLTSAIAVVPQPKGNWLNRVAASGAIGFLATVGTSDERGRIELAPDCSFFGFSLTAEEIAVAQTCAEQSGEARVRIELDRTASMPVFTGALPGTRPDEEIWVVAHLCHPRPGANDNASGVAAALGIATVLSGQAWFQAERSIRFVSGPEFTGIAALLHTCMANDRPLPVGVINLDMVGEDQSVCGGPLVVERSPDCIPSLINPLAEEIVREVFLLKSDVSGKWKSMPFRGFSDHALFADPLLRCPAVQLCHHPDRFNHSSLDSLNKVSPAEMLRSAVSGAALARLLADDRMLTPATTTRIVQDWCAEETVVAAQIAQQYRDDDEDQWAQEFTEYIEARNRSLQLLGSPLTDFRASSGPVLQARWEGPFNTRAMIASMPTRTRDCVCDLVSEDKSVLSLLLNFAIRIDGRRSRREIRTETSFALGYPLAEDKADFLFDSMIESLWVAEASGGRVGVE